MLLVILTFAITFSGCQGDAEQDGFITEQREEPAGSEELHPQEEAIPYHTREHLIIDQSQELSELEDVPAEMALLHAYLTNSDDVELTELNFDAYDAGGYLIARQLGTEEIIMMDIGHQLLYQFNPATGDTTTLAEAGPGPGELQYPADITVTNKGNVLYVAQQDMRIDKYDCSEEECVYEKTITLEHLPYSLTAAGPGQIAAVTIPDPVEGDIDEGDNLIILINEEGDQLKQFGKPYDTDIPMAHFGFNKEAQISYSRQTQRYVMAFSSLPLIYLYNRNEELEKTFKISPFLFGTAYVDKDRGTMDYKATNNSFIDMKFMEDDRFLLIQINTIGEKIYHSDTQEAEFERQTDYYLLDLSKKESYHIGTKEHETSNRFSIIPIRSGFLINEGGILSIIT